MRFAAVWRHARDAHRRRSEPAAPTIRKALTAVDLTQSFYSVMTMEQALSGSIAPRRFNLLLLGTFALVALVLAVVGSTASSRMRWPNTRRRSAFASLGAERSRVVHDRLPGHDERRCRDHRRLRCRRDAVDCRLRAALKRTMRRPSRSRR